MYGRRMAFFQLTNPVLLGDTVSPTHKRSRVLWAERLMGTTVSGDLHQQRYR